MRYRVLNNGILEFFDATANTVGSIGANGTNMKITANNGVIELGNTPSDVQVGTAGTLTNWTFLGGGTIGAGGIGTISMGQSGDTVNMNVSGVVYQYPSSFLRFNEISGANNKINITTQVPGSVILNLPNRPVVGALTLTDSVNLTSTSTGTLAVNGPAYFDGEVVANNGIIIKNDSRDFAKLEPKIVWRRYSTTGVQPTDPNFFTAYLRSNSAATVANTTFVSQGTTPNITAFTFSGDNYIVEFSGYIYANTGGVYTFGVNSDDNSDCFIDGKLVADWYVAGGHGANASGTPGGNQRTIYLNQGYHRIYTRFSEVTGGDAHEVCWRNPGDAGFSVIPTGQFYHHPTDLIMNANDNILLTQSTLITNTTNSISNTTGALIVSGGMGITGNLFMSAANNFFTTTNGLSYRLGWTDNYFARDERFGGMTVNGSYIAFNSQALVQSPSFLTVRTFINNDQGNNTVLFAGSSPVRLQNTAASTSNTTGSLIVGGGLGVSGSIFSNSFITSTDNTNYVARLDNFGAGGGPRLEFGTPATPNAFMSVGAYNNFNNIDTNNRNFRLGSTAVTNIMLANATTGVVTFANSVIISGNLTVVGNVSSENVQSLSVADPLIKLGIGNYTSDLRDIGFAAHYNDGTNAHTGLIRDAGTKEYYLFQGYTPELDSNNNVIITDASFRTANLNSNIVRANLVGNTISLNGLDIGSFVTSAFNQANVTIGVDTTQNTRLTVIEGTNASQNVRIDYSNTAITIAQGVDNSQNVRIDYSNTAITIIQGTNTTQNTNIAATDGKMSSAYNTANNAVANIGPVITTNTVATVIIANTTASTSNSTGALVVSGGFGVAGNTFLNNSLAAVRKTGAVNYLEVTGNTTGGSVVLSAKGSDTNVSMNLTSKNAGSINFIVSQGGNAPVVTIASGSAVFGDPATPFIFSPTIPGAWGSKLTLPGGGIATIQTPDSNSLRFGTFGGTGVGGYFGNTQFNITHTGSAVNYLEVTGNTTGGSPVLSAQGNDTNIGINLLPKGNGSVNITSTATSTSNTTGALVVSGGVGVSGNVYVGGTTVSNAGISFANSLLINSNRALTNYGTTHNVLGLGSGNTTIDLTLGNFVSANCNGITTWTFSNPLPSPIACGFILELTNGGSATQNWPSVKWPGGTAPTLTASGVDVLTFITDDGGTIWRGVVSMLDSK